ncbi:MAG: hypothetical protein QM489_01155 [Candidatus Izemoplasma sp.]
MPCEISSQDLYNIIRERVKQNINYENAAITSDYDFCFTVKRKLQVDWSIHSTKSKKILAESGIKLAGKGKVKGRVVHHDSDIELKPNDILCIPNAGIDFTEKYLLVY